MIRNLSPQRKTSPYPEYICSWRPAPPLSFGFGCPPTPVEPMFHGYCAQNAGVPERQRSWGIGSASLVAPPLLPGHRSPPQPYISPVGPSARPAGAPGTRPPLPAPGGEPGDGTPTPPVLICPVRKFFHFSIRGKSEPPGDGTRPNFSRNKIRLANPAFRDDSGTSLRDPYLPLGPALIVASWSP